MPEYSVPRRRANSSDDALASHLSEWSLSGSEDEWRTGASQREEAQALGRGLQHPWANLSPAEDLPDAPPVIGPFRVIEQLGRGGMGVVYRAVHLDTGEHVAVKMVRSVDPRRIERLRREIRALARLVHPLIVRIIYSGDSDLGPWYAMPILTGESLAQHCGVLDRTEAEPDYGATLPAEVFLGEFEEPSDEWWSASKTPREPTDPHEEVQLDALAIEALRVVQLLCSPLAYLHGEGLVHRDLKPDNILIAPRGVPVVVDFGLTGEFGGAVSRERLERRMGVVGTPAYMSPEQIRGDLVDARSDLYAVGCILYELLAGQPPHVGDTVAEVFRGHLDEVPEKPSVVRGAPLPAAVDELVLDLLEKDPLNRTWHADDLAVRLGAILEDAGAAPAVLPEGLPPARPYLYRPGFVGRLPEVTILGEMLESLRDGRGGMILVGGAAGAGKTRLGLEVVKRMGQIGTLVLVSEGDSATPDQPLGMLEPIFASIADFCRAGGPVMTDEILGASKALLTQFSPSLAALPGAHCAAVLPDYVPAGVAKVRVIAQVWQLLASMVDLGPVGLVFDELHRADELTLDFLASVAGGNLAGSAPLLIVGTYRQEEAPPQLERLLRIPRVRSHSLGGLTDENIAAMVGNMLGLAYPPQSLVRFVAARAGGNPFAVAEYLRTALESNLLSRDATGRWVLADETHSTTFSTLGLPTSLGELIQGRLRALHPSLQELLVVVASAKGPIDAPLIASVVGRDVRQVRDQLEGLMRQELVGQEDSRFDLAHDLVRRAVTEALDPESIYPVQTQLCAGWLRRRAAGQEVPLDRLADALRALARADEASELYLEAARNACARGALGVAGRCYQAHLELSPYDGLPRLVATREWVEGVLLFQGPTAALRVLEVAVPKARALGSKAEVSRLQMLRGQAFLADGKLDAAVEALEEALETGAGRVPVPRLVDARARMTEALLALDRVEDAEDAAARAVRDAKVAGGATRGAAIAAQAGVIAATGNMDRARELYEEALLLHQSGAPDIHARVLVAAAGLDMKAGEYGRASARLDEAREAVELVGDPRLKGWILEALARLALFGGDAVEAMSLYGMAVDTLRAAGSVRTLMVARAELARAHAWRGELKIAAELLAAALAGAPEVRGVPGTTVRLRMAEVAITRGELGEAQRHLKSARSMAPRRLVGEVDALAVRLRRQSEGAMFAVSTAMVLVSAARDAGEPAMVVQAISEAAPTLRDVARYDEARALAREGFDLARGLGHAFGEVRLLTESATQARFEGLFDEAEALLEAVAKRAARIGDMVSLAHIACERGHLYLARGESVSGALGDARVRVERLGLSENAEARRRLVALTRAVSAHGADKLLFHGARLEDYPPAVRALLAASG